MKYFERLFFVVVVVAVFKNQVFFFFFLITYSHHYFMPKHFRLVRVIYNWAQTKLKNVEPKGEKKGFVRVMSRWREALFLIRG